MKRKQTKNNKLVSAIILFAMLTMTSRLLGQTIRNVDFTVTKDNKIVVSYTITGVDASNAYNISLLVSTDGGKRFSKVRKATGDVGVVKSSGRKQIVWDVLAERQELVTDKLVFRVKGSEVMDLRGIDQVAAPITSREPVTTTFTPSSELRTAVLNAAVVEFQEKGNLGIKDAGAIVAEWMSSSLLKTRVFDLYERVLLQKVLEEQELGLTGAFDDQTTAKIGKIFGVEAIVTGTVSKFGNTVSVVAKLIDTKTAKVMATADVKTTNVDAIPDAMDELAWELAKEP